METSTKILTKTPEIGDTVRVNGISCRISKIRLFGQLREFGRLKADEICGPRSFRLYCEKVKDFFYLELMDELPEAGFVAYEKAEGRRNTQIMASKLGVSKLGPKNKPHYSLKKERPA